MSLLDAAKEEMMFRIARLTNPSNPALREVVEKTDPADVDLTTLTQIAEEVRKSAAAKKSVTGE